MVKSLSVATLHKLLLKYNNNIIGVTNLPVGQANHVLLSRASKTPLFHQTIWTTIHGFSLAWAFASMHPSLELKGQNCDKKKSQFSTKTAPRQHLHAI